MDRDDHCISIRPRTTIHESKNCTKYRMGWSSHQHNDGRSLFEILLFPRSNLTCPQFLFFGYTIACTVAAYNGFTNHLQDLGLPQAVKAIKWEITGQSFNIAAIGTSKSSVAVFLLRIVTRKDHVLILWFCIASTSFVCASCIVFMFTQCTPIASVFNPSLPHTCYLNFTVNAIFSGSKSQVCNAAFLTINSD